MSAGKEQTPHVSEMVLCGAEYRILSNFFNLVNFKNVCSQALIYDSK